MYTRYEDIPEHLRKQVIPTPRPYYNGRQVEVGPLRQYEGVKPDTIGNAVRDLLQDMNKGQYAIFVAALEQLGGELRLDFAQITAAASGDARRIEVDATDGPVIIRLQ